MMLPAASKESCGAFAVGDVVKWNKGRGAIVEAPS